MMMKIVFSRLSMKHINTAMEEAEKTAIEKNEADISIVERIVRKTQNRRIAAVLAIDLFLVGVDTVCSPFTFYNINFEIHNIYITIVKRRRQSRLPQQYIN